MRDNSNATSIQSIPVGVTPPTNGQTLVYNSSTLQYEPAASSGGDVTAAAAMADNSLIRGDGGAKGVQDSGILIDDSDNITAVTSITVGNTGLVVGSSTPFSDSSGTLTLQNIDAIDATTETTLETAIDSLSNLTTVGTITSGTWSADTIAVNKGGTGQTSYTDGQLLIGNTTGNTLAKATLTGTTNQVTVTNGSGTITLSLPQSIHTSATPTFANATLSDSPSLVLGTSSSLTGSVIFRNSTNSNSTIIQSGAAASTITFTLPTTDGNASEFLQTDGNGVLSWASSGGGDVTAAAAMTDNSIVRGDGGAKGVQDTAILIDDSDNLSGATSVSTGTFATTTLTGTVGQIVDFGSGTQATGAVTGLSIGNNFNGNSAFDVTMLKINNASNIGAGKNLGLFIENIETGIDTANPSNQGAYFRQNGVDGTVLQIYGNTSVNCSTNGLCLTSLAAIQSGASILHKLDTGTSTQDHNTLYLTGTRHSVYIGDADQAPGTTTNKLYSLAGQLQWDGQAILDAASTTSALTTVGALNSGSITSGFGNIDVGASSIDGGTITADTAFSGTSLTNAAAITISSTGAGVNITTHTDATDDFTVNTTMLVVEGDSGNVGIGTSSPVSPLDVGNVTGNYGTIGVVSDTNHKALNIEENSGGESWQIGVNADGDLGFMNSNAAFTSSSVVVQDSGQVGIGTTTPDGLVNIFSGDSGATANGGADELVIENSSGAGMSILSPDANDSLIYWGSPSDAIGASAFWNYDAKLFALGSSTASGEVSIRSGDSAEAIRIDSTGQVGIGTSTPDGNLHVYGGDAAQGRIRLEGGEAQSARLIFNPDQGDDNADSVQIEVVDGGKLSIESFATGAWVESMVVDSGQVGIGTSSPGEELHVVDSSSSTNVIRYTAIFDAETDADMVDGFGAGIRFQATDSGASGEFARIAGVRDGGDNEGALVFLAGTGGAEEFMRIDNDGQVGIGTTTPTSELQVDASGGGIIQATRTNTGFSFVLNSFLSGLEFGGEDADSGTDNDASAIYSYADGTWTNSSHPTHMRFATTTSGTTSSSEKMRIDNAGNVGIGNSSLEAWDSNFNALQLGGTGSLFSDSAQTAGRNMYLSQNVYYDGDWKYIVTDEASNYAQSSGEHKFRVAASGTADATITWTEAMKIDNVGGISYNPTSDQSIVAGTGVTAAMLKHIIRIVGSGGAVDITANPQIADGTDGQIIILQGTNDTNTVQFDDGTGLALAGAASFVMGQNDTLQLMYDSGEDLWIEISRSNN